MAALALGASSVVAGCGLFPTLSQLEGGCANNCGGASGTTTGSVGDPSTTSSTISATSGVSSSNASSSDASSGSGGASPCPGIHGPTMVHFVSPAGVSICIDSTKVTVAQYFEFETAATQMTTLPVDAECSFKNQLVGCNTDSMVGGTCSSLSCCVTPLLYIQSYYQGAGATETDHPVIGIDYCDAQAYCKWAGKRLCGTTDPNKTQGDVVATGLFPTSEWGLACRGPVMNMAFGFTDNSNVASAACNINKVSSGNPYEHTTGVGENPNCATVWPAGSVGDMIGNERELENNCTTDNDGGNSAIDMCHARSAAYFFDTTYANCDFADASLLPRNKQDDNTSFRCCADPN